MLVLTSQGGWGLLVVWHYNSSIHEGEALLLLGCCRDSRGRQCVYLSIVPSAGEFPVCMGALFLPFLAKE